MKDIRNKLTYCLLPVLLFACSKSDPILPGHRIPIFGQNRLEISDEKVHDLGEPLQAAPCDFTIDRNNQIWQGERRIFSGFPTASKINVQRKVVCNGRYVYAGLSTGELVKVNSETRNIEWIVDIFAPHIPTGGSPFLDIIAPPVFNNGYIYAGGLGGAFCRIRDRDGAKIWCLPISVQDIVKSTRTFNVIRTTDGERFAISTDGTVYNYNISAKRR